MMGKTNKASEDQDIISEESEQYESEESEDEDKYK